MKHIMGRLEKLERSKAHPDPGGAQHFDITKLSQVERPRFERLLEKVEPGSPDAPMDLTRLSDAELKEFEALCDKVRSEGSK